MKRGLIKWTAGMGLGVLVACSNLVPSEKQQSQSVRSTEAIVASHDLTIQRALEVGPEMARRIAPDGTVTSRNLPEAAVPVVRETLTVHDTASQSAGSHDTARGTLAVTIPLGVKLVLLGVSLAILLAALIWAWRYVKTTALGQGISLADQLAASQIQKLRERASLATDPAQQAQHLSDIAALEATRGKLSTKGIR